MFLEDTSCSCLWILKGHFRTSCHSQRIPPSCLTVGRAGHKAVMRTLCLFKICWLMQAPSDWFPHSTFKEMRGSLAQISPVMFNFSTHAWKELTLSPSSPGGPGGPPGPGRPTGPWIPSLPAGPWGPFSPYGIDWHNTSVLVSNWVSEFLDNPSNVILLRVLLSLQLGLEVLEVQGVLEDL